MYGWVMSGYLPYSGFKCLQNTDTFDVNSVSENSSIGYTIKVYLDISWNEYPLAPEKLAIPYDMHSDYCKKITDKHEIKVDHVKKLIPSLGNKTNYVLHYRNLQLYLSLGMKLTKIHTVLKFKQSAWMKK